MAGCFKARAARLLMGALIAAGSVSGVAHAELLLPMPFGGRCDVAVPVRSMAALRFHSVIRQQRDFSCGAAALATLLRYHYAQPVSEADVFAGMWATGDHDRIRQVGFSLLEMKRYLAARGLTANGYAVDLDKIAKAGVPGIALLTISGYKHFVVVKGVSADRVLVGDPALGLRAVSRDRFLHEWNGVYFVIARADDVHRPLFNAASQWSAAPAMNAQGRPRTDDPWTQRALAMGPGEF
ncbi:hypothetical protein BH10PSE13_BH10PSE13_04340 [soil metagenome]